MSPTKVLVGLVAVVVLLFAVVIGLHGGQDRVGGGDPANSRLADLRERFLGAAELDPDDVKAAPCLGPDRKSFVVGSGGRCEVDVSDRVRRVVLRRVQGQAAVAVVNRKQKNPAVPDDRAGPGNPIRLDVFAEGSTLVLTCPRGQICRVAIGDGTT